MNCGGTSFKRLPYWKTIGPPVIAGRFFSLFMREIDDYLRMMNLWDT